MSMLLPERLQLVGRGRPIGVGGDEQRATAEFQDVAGELRCRGRLAGALEADHRDDRRRAGQVEIRSPADRRASSSSLTILTTCCRQ